MELQSHQPIPGCPHLTVVSNGLAYWKETFVVGWLQTPLTAHDHVRALAYASRCAKLEAKSLPLSITTAGVDFLADAEPGTPWWPVLECILSLHTKGETKAALFSSRDTYIRREFLVTRHADGLIETAERESLGSRVAGMRRRGFSTRFACFSTCDEVVAGLEELKLSPSEIVALFPWGAGEGC